MKEKDDRQQFNEKRFVIHFGYADGIVEQKLTTSHRPGVNA